MRPRFTAAASLVGILALALPVTAPAQVDVARFNKIKHRLQQLHATYAKMPPAAQKMMDGTANAEYLYSALNRIQPQLIKVKPGATRPELAAAFSSATSTGGVKVNDNSTDLAFSSFLGFTQSETHTAQCGSNVVVGFNDSGSFASTVLTGTGGASFSGVAVSHDGGKTFKDLGPTPAGASPLTGRWVSSQNGSLIEAAVAAKASANWRTNSGVALLSSADALSKTSRLCRPRRIA